MLCYNVTFQLRNHLEMADGKPGRPKGLPKTGGRKAGVNAVNDLRKTILESLELAGGKDYLYRQANENPAAYLSLVGKVIPKESILSGPDGGPIQHSINVTFE